MAFARRCIIEIQSGKITGTLTDYRGLFTTTHNDLKQPAGGGYMRNANAYDFRLFSNASLTSAIPFVLEDYKSATGTIIFHTKHTLAAGSKIYAGFGDPSLTSNASDATNTFGSTYSCVLPFGDGSTLSVADISGNGNNGTNNGCSASSGILGGGASFDGSNDYIQIADFHAGNSLGISGLLNLDVNNVQKALIVKRTGMTGGSGTTISYMSYIDSNGKLFFGISNNGAGLLFPATGATTVSTGTIHTFHFVHDGVNSKIYLDGAQDASTGAASSVFNGDTPTNIGDDGSAGRFLDGILRHVRITGESWSAAWVEADHNAWIDPSSFASYTFGPPDAPPQPLIFVP